MTEENKVAIILVNYNGAKYNSECINSIFNCNYKNIEIIVVDNDSKDNSIELLEAEFNDCITLIKSGKNLGFSGANNIGIKKALHDNADYIMLLNNDTIVEPTFIKEMILASQKYNNAVISPKIYYYDNKDVIWSAGADMRWKKGVSDQRGINLKDIGSYEKDDEIVFATGCCLLIPTEVVKKVGFMSDDYFLYYEDTDYCMRIREKGYKIVYNHKAIIYHKVSASTGGEESPMYIYYNTRNRLLFNERFNHRNKIYYIPYFYITRVVKIFLWLIQGKIELIRATIDGIKDYNLKKFGIKIK